MILTAENAKKLIENERDNMEYVVNHCLCVGNTAGKIASVLGLDSDKAKALGFVHDIGKRFHLPEDGALVHGYKGYEFLREQGYDDEFAQICILHSYLNNDIDCIAAQPTNRNGFMFEFQNNLVKNHEYTIYQKMINLCDLMCRDQVMTMEKRLIDIITRHGAFTTTQYHVKEALKLKKFFDEKLGFNVYDLFPEISKNL